MGLYAITQLDIIKETVFYVLFPLLSFSPLFLLECFLSKLFACGRMSHSLALINIYAWEQHKALFWMLSHFTVCWLLAWSLYLENTVYTCMLSWLNFLFVMGLQPVLHENHSAYCNIFSELSGYLKKAKWKIGGFFSRCITTFEGEL